MDLSKYNLTPELEAQLKTEIKTSKSEAIQKRLARVKQDETTTEQLARLKELEQAESERQFKSILDKASESFKFKEGMKDRALKLSGVSEEDDLETIKSKITETSKEFEGLLFEKESTMADQINQAVDGEQQETKTFPIG